MKKLILSFAVLIAGIGSMLANHQGEFGAYRLLKPLTTMLIILIAWLYPSKENKVYSKYILIGLCFCLAGDVLLLNEAYFLFGLASFLAAHLFFTYAFNRLYGFSRNFMPLMVLGIICVSYFIYLQPGLGDYTLPVAIYMAIIVVMTWQAISLYFREKQKVYGLIALAALLFMLSDSLLAYNKFKEPFALADLLILTTYWLAIYTLAFTNSFIKKKSLLT